MQNSIPSNAKLVFKGKLFEVWQWEQKMFDSSIKIFEAVKRNDAATIIPVVGDKILLQIQEQPHKTEPFVSFPGGMCDKGESPIETAKRELLEESGLFSDDWILWQTHTFTKVHWTLYTYIARNCVYKQRPQLDAGERIQARLISFDELLKLPNDSSFRHKELVEPLLRASFCPDDKKTLYNLLLGK